MSHPNKKSPEDLRTRRHVLLLTGAEHAQYSSWARDAGISLNEWVRSYLPKPEAPTSPQGASR